MAYDNVTSYTNPTVESNSIPASTRNLEPIRSSTPSELMLRLIKEKKIARDFQTRRHDDWNDAYDLYRGVNKTNRLTQRQAVNIPLLKETVKTLLSNIDDLPSIEWKEKSGDLYKQMIFQEKWNESVKEMNLEGLDIQDKKVVILYGRSHKFINWDSEKDMATINIIDPFDIVIDPLVSPLDIETARFFVRQNIFRSLREILADERYDEEAKDRLKVFLSTKDGLIQSESNRKEYIKRSQRLKDMGVLDDKFPNFPAGDLVVNLSEHYTLIWDKKKEKFVRNVVTYADDAIEMMVEPLKDLIGVEFWPLTTWGEDIETVDYWSDAPADIIRSINKIINVWYSQLVENRTLKNFQMHWYDASIQGYVPQTYEPGPGRMLPSPGDPNKTIMPVDISGLDDTIGAINFLIGIGEKATATTAIQKGQRQPGEKKHTKAEVQALIQMANERILTIAKFYKRSWYETCRKWYLITDANATKKETLYKTAKSGKIYSKEVKPKDWKSEAGYMPIVRSTSEQENEKTKTIQRFQFIMQMFPTNPALKKIAQRRSLDILDLSAEELKEIEDAEKQVEDQQQKIIDAQKQQIEVQSGISPIKQPIKTNSPSSSPEEQALLQQLEQRLGQIEATA